eukprot:m.220353 g.220353  ORF g.220353 m.220353 type:complete len:410 (-) comp33313_c0_seq3:98-1327(-)
MEELKTMVVDSLKEKGTLGKLKAELRASVFFALDQRGYASPNDVARQPPVTNPKLVEFSRSKNGRLVLDIVREFLQFFELGFTESVFVPEANLEGMPFPGRDKLEGVIPGADGAKNQPLLASLLEACLQSEHAAFVNLATATSGGHKAASIDPNSGRNQLHTPHHHHQLHSDAVVHDSAVKGVDGRSTSKPYANTNSHNSTYSHFGATTKPHPNPNSNLTPTDPQTDSRSLLNQKEKRTQELLSNATVNGSTNNTNELNNNDDDDVDVDIDDEVDAVNDDVDDLHKVQMKQVLNTKQRLRDVEDDLPEIPSALLDDSLDNDRDRDATPVPDDVSISDALSNSEAEDKDDDGDSYGYTPPETEDDEDSISEAIDGEISEDLEYSLDDATSDHSVASGQSSVDFDYFEKIT